MKLFNFWRLPFFWLLAQALVVFFVLLSTGSLRPEMVPDSGSYRDTAEARSVAEALSSHRTWGYPLFFKLAGLRNEGRVDGSQRRHINLVTRRLPKLQAAAYLAAVLLFWYGVRVYTGAPWLAFAAALPLLYSNIWSIVQRIQPDFLAAALALASVSLLLLLAARFGGRLLWVALAAAVLLTYHVRPAYVFLLALVPVMGAMLCLVRGPARPRRALLLGLGLLGTTLLPYLLFCALRWSVVGHFGLVSFGGINVTGITASFLERNLVRQLPKHRGLARRLLLERQRRGMESYEFHEDGVEWHDQHNQNVYKIALPQAYASVKYARRRAEPGAKKPRGLGIEANELLTELSLDIIRKRPLLYAKWIWDSFVACLDRGLEKFWIRWPAILLALSWPLAMLLGRGGSSPPAERPENGARGLRVLALPLLATGFFVAHAAIVIMVVVPYERFLLGMLLLLPSALCAALFEVWRRTLVGAGTVLR